MENIKFVDCFVYQDNIELLKFRISRLYKFCYKFVISGVTENDLETLNLIPDPLNKIEVVQIDDVDLENKKTLIEDSIFEILHTFDDDCFFYFSYLDQIHLPEYINWTTQVVMENTSNILKIPLKLTDGTLVEDECGFIVLKKHLGVHYPSQIREYILSDESELKFSPICITMDGSLKKFGVKHA
jgi:hypothetical protein